MCMMPHLMSTWSVKRTVLESSRNEFTIPSKALYGLAGFLHRAYGRSYSAVSGVIGRYTGKDGLLPLVALSDVQRRLCVSLLDSWLAESAAFSVTCRSRANLLASHC